ncbi:hypothetical protein RIR_jg9324.t1 [Rhizophagus irregularis DAOM 181602=DAOM 197198]|nr:hypothetical protein RIR_jg9324.t1 [Rhizophagus irregularis DAOM 181602=DAOM 197198]
MSSISQTSIQKMNYPIKILLLPAPLTLPHLNNLSLWSLAYGPSLWSHKNFFIKPIYFFIKNRDDRTGGYITNCITMSGLGRIFPNLQLLLQVLKKNTDLRIFVIKGTH